MIPLFWRSLIKEYSRFFLLSLLTFIALLLVTRLKEIAAFCAIAANGLAATLYILYQIPLVLPLALPISAFLATYLLFCRLSRDHELTAILTSGISYKQLFMPIIFIAYFLCLLNLFITFSLSPYTRAKTKTAFFTHSNGNPLSLIQRKELLPSISGYLEMSTDSGEKKAQKILWVQKNPKTQLLQLTLANKAEIEDRQLTIHDFTHLSILPHGQLALEHRSLSNIDADMLAQMMKEKKMGSSLQLQSLSSLLRHFSSREGLEIARRIFLSILPFLSTIIALSYSIDFSRKRAIFSHLPPASLLLLSLLIYAYAKSLKTLGFLSIFLYGGYPVIVLIMLYFHKKRRGIV